MIEYQVITNDYDSARTALKKTDSKIYLDIFFSHIDPYHPEVIKGYIRPRLPEDTPIRTSETTNDSGQIVTIAKAGEFEGDGFSVVSALIRLLADVLRRGNG